MNDFTNFFVNDYTNDFVNFYTNSFVNGFMSFLTNDFSNGFKHLFINSLENHKTCLVIDPPPPSPAINYSKLIYTHYIDLCDKIKEEN